MALTSNPDLYENHPGFFRPRNDNIYRELRSRAKIHGQSRHDWPAGTIVPKVDIPYRFCITRDPVERFLSGYRNRVLFHKEIPGNPNIHQFIRNFNNYYKSYRTVQQHFKPQVAFYGTDPSIYTNIFSIDRMSEVREFFEDIYKITIPDIRLQQGGNEIKIGLTYEQEDWIRNKYKADYETGWC